MIFLLRNKFAKWRKAELHDPEERSMRRCDMMMMRGVNVSQTNTSIGTSTNIFIYYDYLKKCKSNPG